MRYAESGEDGLPVFGYQGGSGAVLVDTSQEREARDDNFVTGRIQRFALRQARAAASFGITVIDIRAHAAFAGHHGQASSALTNLHKEGLLVRLKATRDRAHVYVLPEHVNLR